MIKDTLEKMNKLLLLLTKLRVSYYQREKKYPNYVDINYYYYYYILIYKLLNYNFLCRSRLLDRSKEVSNHLLY